MKNRFLFSILTGIVALVLFGCASVKVNSTAVYEGTYQSYLKVLGEWTRSQKLYHNFRTELVITATYYSGEYREALRAEKARSEKLTPGQLDRLVREDEGELAGLVRFLVHSYTPVRSWNDLSDKAPSFRLWLLDAEGRQVGPIRIKEVKLKKRSDHLYHPNLHQWGKSFEVVFPNRTDDGEPLVLTGGKIALLAAGIQGTARLEWDIP